MARYKPYERYKDSGVEWIGEMPEHWEAYRVKRKFRIINGATPSSSEPDNWDGDILWVTPVDLSKNDSIVLYDSIRKITHQGYLSCGTTIIPPGSLILSTRAPIGYVMEAGKEMCTNQGCKSLVRRNNFNTRFFYYHVYSAKNELQSLGRGTTFLELGNQTLGDLVICFPSTNEQQAIADFLDQKTSEIDGLVADKEMLVTRLQEYRQAIICEAVTKGLNPDVKMKDSGVEWIGEIPEHWEVNKLKRLSLIVTGNTPSKSNEENYQDGFFEWVKPDNIEDDGNISSSAEKLSHVGVLKARLIPKGSALVCCIGTVGKVGMATQDLTTNQQINSVVFDKPDLWKSRFGFYVLKSSESEHQRYANKVVVAILNKNSQGNISLPVPPIDEQQAIADYLDQKTSEIDDLISGIQESIHQLKSYRQSLISEAVTGKIDVRGVI